MTNKANLTDECRKHKSQHKNVKKLTYGAPAIETDTSDDEKETSSNDEDISDEVNQRKVKDVKKLVSKAQINPEQIKISLEENKNIMTPVNLQLVGWNKITMGKETKLEVDLSDSKFVYKFLMTDQFSWMFGGHIKMNTILTVSEIKKKQGRRIIMHMMIDKNIQVNTMLGNPINI